MIIYLFCYREQKHQTLFHQTLKHRRTWPSFRLVQIHFSLYLCTCVPFEGLHLHLDMHVRLSAWLNITCLPMTAVCLHICIECKQICITVQRAFRRFFFFSCVHARACHSRHVVLLLSVKEAACGIKSEWSEDERGCLLLITAPP